MKPIKRSELKEGDIVATEKIFNIIRKGNLLHSSHTIMEVKKIAIRSDKKQEIYVRCWEVVGNNMEIRETNLPYTIKGLSLLDGKELSDFKKHLILNTLEK
ncbi:MAG: hypothetical protein AABY22_33455 [Nanoarchaeota archaeon]